MNNGAEPVTLDSGPALSHSSQGWSLRCGNQAPVTLRSRGPRAMKVGGDGRDPGNSDKALVIHRNVPRNGRHVFLCLA